MGSFLQGAKQTKCQVSCLWKSIVVLCVMLGTSLGIPNYPKEHLVSFTRLETQCSCMPPGGTVRSTVSALPVLAGLAYLTCFATGMPFSDAWFMKTRIGLTGRLLLSLKGSWITRDMLFASSRGIWRKSFIVRSGRALMKEDVVPSLIVRAQVTMMFTPVTLKKSLRGPRLLKENPLTSKTCD